LYQVIALKIVCKYNANNAPHNIQNNEENIFSDRWVFFVPEKNHKDVIILHHFFTFFYL
jgi:hypothetical protein